MVKYKNIIKAIDETLSKTHDGTSSGPFKQQLKNHITRYADRKSVV